LIIPPLPQDIFYVSKVYIGKFGGRIILPIEKILEPYLGCTLDISSYQIGFGNKNGVVLIVTLLMILVRVIV